MAEDFATTEEFYCITGEQPVGAELLPSTGNGKKSMDGSERRLASLLRLDAKASNAPLIGAGSGRFLIQWICLRLKCPYVEIESLSLSDESIAFKVAESASALALASLVLEGSK
ncbi:MAG: hypothetical protein B6D70_11680 [gamma proteobacterium symbiont of Stewartia floridana]|nr:hypothetical protein [Candidatus Thiodiazotropha taylori]RLW55294.1 MAG: hypothetical protein B6D76_04315 [gamma proteobacterium symbiont of Stewartia floridana]RLW57788.1 MAG: hypothetical protein B6D75_15980 [gamma proteobacterium symbiont of Stewartia floridana]RLW59757.1 MAG: hypothetical protein B6D70_11680 [gamma proteobacterium symbiont of Stewartia floridana]RLW63370.1 MAG: hypothetical protein B6D73_15480 [gamma proteobacterium symbiont of Stewartia floridana]